MGKGATSATNEYKRLALCQRRERGGGRENVGTFARRQGGAGKLPKSITAIGKPSVWPPKKKRNEVGAATTPRCARLPPKASLKITRAGSIPCSM